MSLLVPIDVFGSPFLPFSGGGEGVNLVPVGVWERSFLEVEADGSGSDSSRLVGRGIPSQT